MEEILNSQQQNVKSLSSASQIPKEDECTIRRVAHTKDYVSILNSTVQDKRISWEARGLLVYLLSLPSDWRIKVSHLQEQGNAGRDGVRRMLKELQSLGYASGFGKPDGHTDSGHFGSADITIYESPPDNPNFKAAIQPTPEKPSSAQPTTAEPTPEKPSLYKEQSLQKTELTKDTPTHLRAIGAPAVSVGGQSKFSLKQCVEYARAQAARPGSSIKDAEAVGRARHRDGADDELIEEYLSRTPEQIAAGRVTGPTNQKMFFNEAVQIVRSVCQAHEREAESVIAELPVDDSLKERLSKHFSPAVNRDAAYTTAVGTR